MLSVEMPAGTITDWEISRVYPARRVNREGYPHFYSIFMSAWQKVETEPSGLLDIARHASRENEDGDLVLARAIFRSEGGERIKLSFGYSDRARVFLNGRLLYAGTNDYRSRDYRYLGTIGLFDELGLPLEEGSNELWVAVSESFGGWGVTATLEHAGEVTVRTEP